MSVFVSINYPGSINLLTDGASWKPDGTLAEIKRKVTWSDRFPVAVTSRGNTGMGAKAQEMIVEIVEEFGFDNAMVHVADGLSRLHLNPALKGLDALEVLIAGFSESLNAVTHLVFHNWRYKDGGGEPMKLYYPGFLIARGTPADPSALPRHGIRPMRNGEDPTAYTEAFGAKMMQAYREVPCRAIGAERPDELSYNLGGHCDLTTITAVGVKVRRLHTWPEDKVGQKIDPFAARKTVVPIAAGMNRQQRRAAARRAA